MIEQHQLTKTYGTRTVVDALSFRVRPGTVAGRRPFEAVIAAFRRVAQEIFADRLELVRVRQAIIESSPELQERELRRFGRTVHRG